MHTNKLKTKSLLAALLVGLAGSALADINVGVVVSATGPAASLGIPEKNTFALMPTSIGGEKINYIILDDASDTTTAVKNTRKLLTENKVDVIIGSTITPELAGDDRRRRRSRNPDDLDGRLGAHRRPGRCEAPLGVQDTAE